MTMMDRDTRTTTCPSWCTAGSDRYPCQGEHSAESAYIPATGREPGKIDSQHGAIFPLVGAAPTHYEWRGENSRPPTVSVHLAGPDHLGRDLDIEVFMRVNEAEALAQAILDAAARLRQG